MEFGEAMDVLLDCPRIADVARDLEVSESLIRKANLDPDNPGHRTPPDRWRAVVRKIARARARALSDLADRLSAPFVG